MLLPPQQALGMRDAKVLYSRRNLDGVIYANPKRSDRPRCEGREREGQPAAWLSAHAAVNPSRPPVLTAP